MALWLDSMYLSQEDLLASRQVGAEVVGLPRIQRDGQQAWQHPPRRSAMRSGFQNQPSAISAGMREGKDALLVDIHGLA